MSDPNTDKSKRLGRGLGALIHPPNKSETATPAAPPTQGVREVAIDDIAPNPYQPRRAFGEQSIRELADSLRTSGLLQPITVRPRLGKFELIAGERRLRAAQLLGWSGIPAIVRDISDREHLQLALVENLQREDLNPIDEAEGYRQLIDEFGYVQQQVADAVGKDRSTIANALRLLNLPTTVRDFVRSGKLSAGHARALLSLDDEGSVVRAAHQVVADSMSVRETERLTQGRQRPPRATRKATSEVAESADAKRITDRLRRYLQTDVHVVADDQSRGEVRIRFYSADDLERLLELIIGPVEEEG